MCCFKWQYCAWMSKFRSNKSAFLETINFVILSNNHNNIIIAFEVKRLVRAFLLVLLMFRTSFVYALWRFRCDFLLRLFAKLSKCLRWIRKIKIEMDFWNRTIDLVHCRILRPWLFSSLWETRLHSQLRVFFNEGNLVHICCAKSSPNERVCGCVQLLATSLIAGGRYGNARICIFVEINVHVAGKFYVMIDFPGHGLSSPIHLGMSYSVYMYIDVVERIARRTCGTSRLRDLCKGYDRVRFLWFPP